MQLESGPSPVRPKDRESGLDCTGSFSPSKRTTTTMSFSPRAPAWPVECGAPACETPSFPEACLSSFMVETSMGPVIILISPDSPGSYVRTLLQTDPTQGTVREARQLHPQASSGLHAGKQSGGPHCPHVWIVLCVYV